MHLDPYRQPDATYRLPARWLRPCRYCGQHIEYDQLLNLRGGKVAHIACVRALTPRPDSTKD